MNLYPHYFELIRMGIRAAVGLMLGMMTVAAADYAVVELQPATGDVESSALALNENGAAVGLSSNADGQPQAVRWNAAGQAEVLITTGRTYSEARDINEAGLIAGSYATPGGVHAALWATDLTLTDLHDQLPGFRSEALTINNAGVVAGFIQEAGGFPLGFLLDPVRGLETFAVPGSFSSRVFSVNEHGALAASGLSSTAGLVAMRLNGEDQLLPNLPTGKFGQAVAINNTGHSSGFSDQADGQEIACCWANGVVTPLGHLGGGQSRALAMNNFGQVVGSSLIDRDSVEIQVPDEEGGELLFEGDTSVEGDLIIEHDRMRAFLWNGSVLVDLNDLIPSDSGWVLLSAEAINDRGQIVGQGLKGGKLKGFLLNPSNPAPPQVALSLPQAGAAIPQGNPLAVQVDANHGSSEVRLYLNNEIKATGSQGRINFDPGSLGFGSHLLKVETYDAQNSLIASREITIEIRDLLFSEWLVRHLGPGADTGTGKEDDTDDDGLTVIEEFAFDFLPQVKEKRGQIPLRITWDAGQPHLTFKRRKAFPDQNLEYTLLSSPDFTEWTDVTGLIELDSQTSDGDTDPLETVRFHYQGTAPERLFFQIEVRTPAP